MKKIYATPRTEVTELKLQSVFLAGSPDVSKGASFSNEEDLNFASRKSSSIWDDEDDDF